MIRRIIQLLIVVLFAWSLWLYLPEDTITQAAFKSERFPYWMDFSPEMRDALTIATAPGTTIGIVHMPLQSKIAVLWNERQSNRVVKIDPVDIELPDYLYLRPGLDADTITVCESRPGFFRCLIRDDWGYIYEVMK